MMTKTDELSDERVRHLCSLLRVTGDISDLDAFDMAVALEELLSHRGTAPLQAQTSVPADLTGVYTLVPAHELLAIRDALVENDLNDAWHHLYTIADPTFCEIEPWRNLEHKAALAASPSPASAQVTEEIAAERERQKSVEGWTPEHDDEHETGQLASAAICYASPEDLGTKTVPHSWTDDSRYIDAQSEPVGRVTVPKPWPWDGQWWKPGDTRRNLVKAGALIVAEIERLDRAALHPGREERE